MDRHSKQQRSKNMRAVKSKNTDIEIRLRKALWKKGVRYRLNNTDIIGKPDISIKKYKIAIFCDSEFWHGKDWERKKFEIKTRRKFWWNKIEKNIKRDKDVNETLKKNGWTVLRFWGKEIKTDLQYCVDKVIKVIQR